MKVNRALKTWIKVFLCNKSNAHIILWEKSDPDVLGILFLFNMLALLLHSRNPRDFQECKNLHYAVETLMCELFSCHTAYNLAWLEEHLCVTNMPYSLTVQLHLKRKRICKVLIRSYRVGWACKDNLWYSFRNMSL